MQSRRTRYRLQIIIRNPSLSPNLGHLTAHVDCPEMARYSKHPTTFAPENCLPNVVNARIGLTGDVLTTSHTGTRKILAGSAMCVVRMRPPRIMMSNPRQNHHLSCLLYMLRRTKR